MSGKIFVLCKVNFGDVHRRKYCGNSSCLLVNVIPKICYKFLGSILSRGGHLFKAHYGEKIPTYRGLATEPFLDEIGSILALSSSYLAGE